jgi:glycosyltransferase involved in cell wall biosynthesis
MNHCPNSFKMHQHVKSRLIVDGCSSSFSPDISIVIPTYRRPHLIKDTLESVIKQSKSDAIVELVIVDNDADSNDSDLERIVTELLPFNIRLFRNEENIGMFGNWNRCIELARAPVLTILNDDDLLHPDFIRSVYKPKMKEMRVVSHKTFSVLADCVWSEVKTGINFSSVNVADFFIGNPVPGSLGMVMNKQCAIEVGGYNETLWPTADYDFTYRYFLAYGLYKTDSFLSAYRWSENESLKSTTLLGFLRNDHRFRNTFINRYEFGSIKTCLLRLLNNTYAVYTACAYNRVNKEFDVASALKESSIPLTNMNIFKSRAIRRLFSLAYPHIIRSIIR